MCKSCCRSRSFQPLEDLLGQIDDFHDRSKPQTGENDCGGDLRCICDTLHSDTHIRPIERRHTAQTITSRASEPLTILQQLNVIMSSCHFQQMVDGLILHVEEHVVEDLQCTNHGSRPCCKHLPEIKKLKCFGNITMRPFLPAYPSLMNALPFVHKKTCSTGICTFTKRLKKSSNKLWTKIQKKNFTISWRDSGRVQQ